MLEPGRPIHGYDADRLQGAIVVRRAREGEQLTTLDGTAAHARPRRPRRHRRLRDHRPGRRDGRGDDRDLRHDHVGARRGGPLGRGVDVPHGRATRSPPRPASATSAASTPRSARRRPTVSSSCSSSTAAARPPGRHRRRQPRRPCRSSRSPATWPPASPGMPITEEQSVACLACGRLRGRRLRHPVGHPAPVAPRPHRRPGLLRGGRPARRLRQGAVGPPDPSVRSRPHPPAAAAAPDRAHAGRRGLRGGGDLPVRRRGRPRRAGPDGRGPAPRPAAPVQPAQRRGPAS